MEIQLANLDNLRTEKRTLEQTQAGGNGLLIANYEDAKRSVDKLKTQEDSLKNEIQRLEKRIHQFDVQIQQEPDVKFDTLVKLRPFFDKVADNLLKKKNTDRNRDAVATQPSACIIQRTRRACGIIGQHGEF